MRKFIVGILDAYHLQLSESAVTNLLAVAVGVITGFGAVFFRWLISYWSTVTAPAISGWFSGLHYWAFVPVPIIGMIIVVIIVKLFAPEAKGHGVPEVIEAVVLKGGRIRGRVAVIKALASSICIGFGGSVGREGPIVQIGSAIGSSIAQFLKMSAERRRWFVACGAGAGIAATFNAPIAGVVFAMEVILHGSTLRSFTSVVLATVSASVIGRIYYGNHPAFEIAHYQLVHNSEYLFYVGLGIVAALAGLFYSYMVYKTEDLFALIKLHPVVKGAIGGLAIGVLVTFYPEVRGVGYETITDVLSGNILMTGLMVLLIAKLLATALTLGAGGSGGIFAPALFMGACLGGAYGDLLQRWFPETTASSGAYAMVGMAAVFTAAARAPLTAIMILFELTGNYAIILPVMLASVVATFTAAHFDPESIYTRKLVRRGIRLRWGADTELLETIKVHDVMHKHTDTLRENDTKSDFYTIFIDKQHQGYPVVDDAGRLVGVVTFNDFCSAKKLPDDTQIGKFCTRNLVTVYPSDDLSLAMKKMGIRDIGRLLVIDPDDPRILLGIITRRDVLEAYKQAHRRKRSDDLMDGMGE